MTEVIYSEGLNHYIRAEYHAGQSLVCAGISAIMYALIGALSNDCDSKIISYKIESGFFEVKFVDEKYYKMALIGLLQIEKSYPKYIKVKSGGEIV